MEMYFGFVLSLSERKMKECGVKFFLCESVVFLGFCFEFSSNWKDDGFGYVNIVFDEGFEVYGVFYVCEKGILDSLDCEYIYEGNRFC